MFIFGAFYTKAVKKIIEIRNNGIVKKKSVRAYTVY